MTTGCARLRRSLYAALALLAACQSSPAPRAPATEHQIRYRLEWTWGRAVTSAAGAAWEVVNDRGCQVSVTRGYVVSYSMELVECPRLSENLGVDFFFAERPAFAGHLSGTPNPAALRIPRVESLTHPVTAEAGIVSVPGQRYCRVHYLIGRAPNTATNLPADVDMVEQSLLIEGRYRNASATEEVPFSIKTAAANGALNDLFPPGRFGQPGAAMQVDTTMDDILVVIRRDLGTLFDGVDFTASPHVVAGQILTQLVTNTKVEVSLNPPS